MAELYYGRGKDEDNEKLIDFLNEVFFATDKEKRNFFTLLPKIYKEQYRPAYNNFVVQDKNGDFRAAVGDFYNNMTVADEDVLTCCIGNVAVGKEYRSKGYMIELMEKSVENMIKNEVDMAYLGGQRQRYGYFGFESAGVVYNFGFNRQTVKHALKNEKSGLKILPLEPDNLDAMDAIESIYSRNVIRSQRTMDRYYDILCSWKSTPYVLFDGNKFVGYFVLDRNGHGILECGAVSPEYIKKMVLAVFETSEEYSIVFPTAPFETDKQKFFSENAEGMDIGGCESILVLNYEKVLRTYLKAKASYNKLADGKMTVLIHGKRCDENLAISVKNNIVSVEPTDANADFELGHHEATRMFFSNYCSDRMKLEPECQQWLPLPAFMFGTDTM